MHAITNDCLAIMLSGQSIGSGHPTDIIILMLLSNFGVGIKSQNVELVL